MDWPISPAIPRVALVTGGARRIGRALVETLSGQGFAVAVHCNASRDEAEALCATLKTPAMVVCANLSREEEVLPLIGQVHDTLGTVGLLVNNASVFERDSWNDVDRTSWDRHLETNLRAPFVLAQAFAAALPRDAEGMVLNILDQRVWNLTPHFLSYTVSKSGLWTLTQTLALALAPRIRVNAIGPGPVLPAAGQTTEHFQAMCSATPLHLGSSPEEIARAMMALLTMPSVTGQMLALDGGQHLQWKA